MTPKLIKQIIEGVLFAAGKPVSITQLQEVFDQDEKPSKKEIEAVLVSLQKDCKNRGFQLLEVASGWRMQVRQELAPWVSRLWEEKPQKYSRALLETLALIAYRQPITRGEIEEVRGVTVSTQIMKTLLERDWVKVIGHKEVPGRPAMYATTKEFLDYFNFSSLQQLPTLADLRDLDVIAGQLNLLDNVADAEDNGALEDQAAEQEHSED